MSDPTDEQEIVPRPGMLVRLRNRHIVTVISDVQEGYMRDTVAVARNIEHVRVSDICEVIEHV